MQLNFRIIFISTLILRYYVKFQMNKWCDASILCNQAIFFVTKYKRINLGDKFIYKTSQFISNCGCFK